MFTVNETGVIPKLFPNSLIYCMHASSCMSGIFIYVSAKKSGQVEKVKAETS